MKALINNSKVEPQPAVAIQPGIVEQVSVWSQFLIQLFGWTACDAPREFLRHTLCRHSFHKKCLWTETRRRKLHHEQPAQCYLVYTISRFYQPHQSRVVPTANRARHCGTVYKT